MNIDIDKLESLLRSLSNNVGGMCCEASVFIGEFNRRAIRITVMTKSEAFEEYEYEGTLEKYDCIMSDQPK